MPRAAPRIAILGAGPIGVEAALAAAERGWPFTLYDAAPEVAGHIRHWRHVRMFTPWEMNVSARVRRALQDDGREVPEGQDLPTGGELVERLYQPVAESPGLSERLRLGTRVAAVGREGLLKHEAIGSEQRGRRPFRLLLEDDDGRERVERADVVLDCTGTYGNPNSLGDGGIPAPGESALEDRIARHLPDLDAEAPEWAGRRIMLSGAGHSAQSAALALARFAREAPGTDVVWAVRAADPTWGAVENDPLHERAALSRAAGELAGGASPAISTRLGAVTEALGEHGGRVEVTLRNGTSEAVVVDRVLSLTGGVGDFSLYRQLQVHECYATCGPMKLAAALLGESGGDCLTQTAHGPETLVNPEPGFFILGSKSYGRNSQFLLRIGWQQVDDVFGLLDPQRAAG